jgi:ATP sulfurylase
MEAVGVGVSGQSICGVLIDGKLPPEAWKLPSVVLLLVLVLEAVGVGVSGQSIFGVLTDGKLPPEAWKLPSVVLLLVLVLDNKCDSLRTTRLPFVS